MTKVVILGGGVAGMSAALELIERGYEVEVFERHHKYVGGKARSIDYSGTGGNHYASPLPGEHGFRFFPGFYKHVIDTMKRIPYKAGGAEGTVYDNLTPTSRIMVAQYDAAPIIADASFPRNFKDLKVILKDIFGVDSGLTHDEEMFFAERVWQLITSCHERRNNDYENLGWWQYLEADKFSDTYKSLLVQGLTRTLVAARAETASTKTGGDVFLQLLFCMTDPLVNTDRVLNGPTNDKWLSPMLEYLSNMGVKFHLAHECLKLNIDKNDRIISATIRNAGNEEFDVGADHFILAVPVERAAALISPEMVKADQTLGYINQLSTSVSWMNGIQFYLNEDVKVNKGHCICSDSEWALTCISQVQFWKDYDIKKCADGNIKGLLSVDISDWFTPGRFTTNKPANECTREEVAAEVWEQLKHSLNHGAEILKDEMKVDYYLDRDIYNNKSIDDDAENSHLGNREPLLVNTVNSWYLRPEASCDIKNLFFAADYVKTHTDLATMEGANEAARRAVNCILDADKSHASKCKVWPLQEPMVFRPFKWYDKMRYDKGMPWSSRTPLWFKILFLAWIPVSLSADFFRMVAKKF